jgi:hypothetical protein
MNMQMTMTDPDAGAITMSGALTISGTMKLTKVEKDNAFTAPAL